MSQVFLAPLQLSWVAAILRVIQVITVEPLPTLVALQDLLLPEHATAPRHTLEPTAIPATLVIY